MSKQTDIKILRNAMLFNLTRHAWQNRSKVDNEKLNTEETTETGEKVSKKATKRISASKRLIVCPEYESVMSHLSDIYNWCLSQSMMATGLSRGVYFVRRDMVNRFEAEIEKARTELDTKLIPAFLAAYPKAKEDAKRPVNDQQPELGGLGSLYNEKDYPTEDELKSSFGIEYSWFALSVPDELPEEIRARENAKLKEKYEEAQTEILYALREGFKEIVSHAVERLYVPPGEKPKVFIADSMVTSFIEFFDTFRAKNLMDDEALENVVNQARDIVTGMVPKIQDVRTNIPLRNSIAGKLTEVNTALDGMLKDRPKRKFQFD